MSHANIKFIYEGTDTNILCSKDDKMKDICQKFANLMGRHLKSFSFIYGGNIIKFQSSFKEQANLMDKQRNEMIVLVFEIGCNSSTSSQYSKKSNSKTETVNVIFTFEDAIIKIEYSKGDKMKDICQKFANLIRRNLNSLNFVYEGKIINFQLSFKEQANSMDNKRNEMKVLVNKNGNSSSTSSQCSVKINLTIEKIYVIFAFEGHNTKIPCSKEDKMKDICQKFANKINRNLNSLTFIYGGNIINFQLSFKEQANLIDKQRNEMTVLVYKIGCNSSTSSEYSKKSNSKTEIVNVIFSFCGDNIKIQCSKEDKMKDICQKYVNLVKLNINSVYFIYEGNILNFQLSFEEQANLEDKKRKEMFVLVVENGYNSLTSSEYYENNDLNSNYMHEIQKMNHDLNFLTVNEYNPYFNLLGNDIINDYRENYQRNNYESNLDFNTIYKNFIYSLNTLILNKLDLPNILAINYFLSENRLAYLSVFIIENSNLKLLFDDIKFSYRKIKDLSLFLENSIVTSDKISKSIKYSFINEEICKCFNFQETYKLQNAYFFINMKNNNSTIYIYFKNQNSLYIVLNYSNNSFNLKKLPLKNSESLILLKGNPSLIPQYYELDNMSFHILQDNLIIDELSSIKSSFLLNGQMSEIQLDPRGDRIKWPEYERRGGEKYDIPKGWIGIGLKAFDKYENDRWLDNNNVEGEWVVAYHGVGRNAFPLEVNQITKSIINTGFKNGDSQSHKNCKDYFHPGKKVGEGVYCTPLIKTAELYAGETIIKGKKYKTVIMIRINPKARRYCNSCEDSRRFIYWVVNPSSDEIRPYRILYKRSENVQ